jgi:hypothetical protein
MSLCGVSWHLNNIKKLSYGVGDSNGLGDIIDTMDSQVEPGAEVINYLFDVSNSKLCAILYKFSQC